MTRENILKEIDNLKKNRFFLAMKDHWNQDDFDYNDELIKKIFSLEKELEKIS